MDKKVRVRFAPSPTGPLHIGGVRTALFNYLLAKKHKGDFILRIEDTDQNRFVDGAEQYIITSLKWCGINPDEGPDIGGKFGPYRQSERKDLYHKYVQQLLDSKWAYIAFDTPEELNQHRQDHENKGKTFIYNWHNRNKLKNSLSLSEAQVNAKIANGEPYVIRFKTPDDQILELTDIVRESIQIDTKTLDDKVLFKSDGMPTYHLANVVDDHLMQITHVIRGEEWLPSLPLHYLLYRAFDWDSPKFAHLPLILKPNGKGKLSKRDGDKFGFPVFPLNWNKPGSEDFAPGYRENGYFPEALVNFLAFLGWNPGTEEEMFNMEELIKHFDLSKVNKSGARFDPDKIRWYNHQYLQDKNDKLLVEQFKPYLFAKINDPNVSDEKIEKVISLIKERADFITDLWKLCHYLFIAPGSFDPKSAKRAWKTDTPDTLSSLREFITTIEDFSAISLREKIQEWIKTNEISTGKVMMPLRLSLVGSLEGPDVYEILSLLGKQETLKRIKKALAEL